MVVDFIFQIPATLNFAHFIELKRCAYASILCMISAMDDICIVHRVELHVIYTVDRGKVRDHSETWFWTSIHFLNHVPPLIAAQKQSSFNFWFAMLPISALPCTRDCEEVRYGTPRRLTYLLKERVKKKARRTRG